MPAHGFVSHAEWSPVKPFISHAELWPASGATSKMVDPREPAVSTHVEGSKGAASKLAPAVPLLVLPKADGSLASRMSAMRLDSARRREKEKLLVAEAKAEAEKRAAMMREQEERDQVRQAAQKEQLRQMLQTREDLASAEAASRTAREAEAEAEVRSSVRERALAWLEDRQHTRRVWDDTRREEQRAAELERVARRAEAVERERQKQDERYAAALAAAEARRREVAAQMAEIEEVQRTSRARREAQLQDQAAAEREQRLRREAEAEAERRAAVPAAAAATIATDQQERLAAWSTARAMEEAAEAERVARVTAAVDAAQRALDERRAAEASQREASARQADAAAAELRQTLLADEAGRMRERRLESKTGCTGLLAVLRATYATDGQALSPEVVEAALAFVQARKVRQAGELLKFRMVDALAAALPGLERQGRDRLRAALQSHAELARPPSAGHFLFGSAVVAQNYRSTC